ncbi:FG-GAP-like repeat-containing protein [Nonomuraea wenchangensis]
MALPGTPSAPARAQQPATTGGADLRIEVPAFHGLEPQLLLTNTGGTGNDWLGVGWALSGLSTIQRIGPGWSTPTYTARDEFSLDGTELVRCQVDTPSPGCRHPSSPTVPIERRYATRIETYARIEFEQTPTGGVWRVWDTSGILRTYRPRLAVSWDAPDRPFSWHLASVADPSGNRVSYQYAADGDRLGTGQQYLRRIEYNGTRISFQVQPRPDLVTSATGRGLLVTRRRLARIDVETGGELLRSYALDYATDNSILREVRQYGRDAVRGPNGTVTGGTATMPITLSTTTPGAGPVGSYAPSTGSDEPWGPPWPDRGFTAASNWDNESANPLVTRYSRAFGAQWQPGDVDADGRTDFIGTTFERSPPEDQGQPFRVLLHTAMPNRNGSRLTTETGTGRYNYRYTSQPTDIVWYNDDPREQYYRPLIGDVNGDGRSDVTIVRLQSRSGNVWLHTALSLGDGRFEMPPPQRIADTWNPRHRWFAADADGDSRADLFRIALHGSCDDAAVESIGCRAGEVFEHAALQVGFSNGDGTWRIAPEQDTDWRFGLADDAHWFVGDADGDGRADIQRVINLPAHDNLATKHPGIGTAFSIGDGTFRMPPRTPECAPKPRQPWCADGVIEINQPWESWTEPLPWLDQPVGSDLVQSGDMDGDGRHDLVLASYYRDNSDFVRFITAFSQGDGTYRAVPHQTRLSALHLNFYLKKAFQRSNYPNRWLTGDWNGDGATDLVVASPSSFDATLWRPTVQLSTLVSDRHGGYAVEQLPTSYHYDCWDRPTDPTGPTESADPLQCPSDLTFVSFLGDVNADGQDDYMYAGVRFTEEPPRTHFRVRTAPLTHEGTQRWRSGDVDGDGRQDLVYPQYTRAGITVHTLLRGRDGRWQHRSQPVLPTLFNPVARDWIIADVGGPDGGPDGRADLVHLFDYTKPGETGLRVETLLANGDGAWVPVVPPMEWPEFTARDTGNWQPADIDGDGDSDLVHVWSTHVTKLSEPGRAIRVHVLRANGDGSWTPLPSESDAWPQFGSADTGNWRVMEVNGDGRADLIHLDGRHGQVLPRTLLSQGDGTWQPVTGDAVPLDASDVRGWRSADANADGIADLVHLAASGGDLTSAVLLGAGNGTFIARIEPAWPSFGGTDTRRWQAADVNGDGATDLIHLDSLGPGLRVRTLLAHLDGSFTPHEPVADAWTGLDAPDSSNWRTTDASGDGRDDLVRVEYARPNLRVRTLLSTAPVDRLTTIDNGVGSRTEITYRPSSEFGIRASPGAGVIGCHLPHGVVLQLPAVIVVRTHGVQPDRTTTSYTCAQWSYARRRLLGWAQTRTEHAAIFNRPAQVTVRRNQLDDLCDSQPVETRLEDGAGRLFTRSVTEYVPAGPPPTICRPERILGYEQNGGPVAQATETTFRYDDFGNVTELRALGWLNDPRDDKVTRRAFRPATGPWIVDRPASEELLDGTAADARLYRHTRWCYDGVNGTAADECPGEPAAKGLVTAVKAARDGGGYYTTVLDYDAFGNQTHVTDPRGNTTTTVYDPVRHIFPETTCNARQQCTTTEWDRQQGLIEATVDINQQRTGYTYDALGRLETTNLPDGGTTVHSYLDFGDPARRRIREVHADGTPDGLWTETYLDGQDRPWQVVREGDQPGRTFVQHTEYADASPLPAAQTNWFTLPAGPAPVLERFAYDAAGRLATQTHPDGTTQRWLFGNHPKRSWVEYTDERGSTRTTLSDAHGRIIEIEESDGTRLSTLAYTYQPDDQPVTITDDLGNVTTHSYDLRGNLVRTESPDLGTWKWTWDPAGNLESQTDARRRTLRFTYDPLNRMKTKRYSGGPTTTWHYDEAGHGAGAGRLTSITGPAGVGCPAARSAVLDYDVAGRITRDTRCVSGVTRTMRFDFDTLGRQRTVIYPDGEQQGYGYDTAGRLRDMAGLIGEFTYDADGYLTRAERADSTITIWTRNPQRHWLDNISITSPVTGPIFRIGYTHEPDGLIRTSTTDGGGPNLSYRYDDLDRLTEVNGDLTRRFTWNTIGNLQSQTGVGAYTYPTPGSRGCIREDKRVPCPRPHAVAQAGDQGYDYDANGNTTAIRTLTAVPTARPEADPDGWYTVRAKQPGKRRDTLWTIAADHLGDPHRWPEIYQLNRNTHYPNPPGGPFRDPDLIFPGQRLRLPAPAASEKVQPTGSCTGPKTPSAPGTRRLRWDDDNQLALIESQPGKWACLRYDSDGSRIEKRYSGKTTRYFGPWLEQTTPGPAADVKYYWAGRTLIAQRDASGLHFHHQDHLGSTMLLTTGTGKVSARYNYEPFGASRQTAGNASTDRRFTGQRLDTETGLVGLGARSYDPNQARFLSPDTILPDTTRTQAANPYLYAYANPLNWTDLSGHQPEDCSNNNCSFEDDPIVAGSESGEWVSGPVPKPKNCVICTMEDDNIVVKGSNPAEWAPWPTPPSNPSPPPLVEAADPLPVWDIGAEVRKQFPAARDIVPAEKVERLLQDQVAALHPKIPKVYEAWRTSSRERLPMAAFDSRELFGSRNIFEFRGDFMAGWEVNYYFIAMAMAHQGYSWEMAEATIVTWNKMQEYRILNGGGDITTKMMHAAKEGFNDERQRHGLPTYPIR